MDETLSDLPLLFVDCQANGPSPHRASPLELGWVWTCARQAERLTPEAIQSFLFCLEPGEVLSSRIAALTGLSPADLSRGQSAGWIWQRLLAALGAPDGPADRLRPAVAHYARYERPLLQRLHAQHGQGTPFPFDLLCTHEIGKRLLPDLPRKSLRALSGYFGEHLAEPKRASAHVLATVVVWRELVLLLEKEQGIGTLAALQQWLQRPPQAVPAARKRFRLARDSRLGLPDSPGVYRMLGKGGQILYVGKATSLRDRVNQYFRSARGLSERTLELVTQIWDVQVTGTETALEAALLETDEIKRHHPPYNQSLRDVHRRKLWHLAPADLSCRLHPSADAVRGPGPIPAASPPILPGLLHGWLLQPDSTPVPEGLTSLVSPADAVLLGAALSCFRTRRGAPGRNRSAWSWLLGLEQTLLAERQAAQSPERSDEEAPSAEQAPAADPLERLVRFLEGWILHLGRLARRGCFIRWLADSRIVWSPEPGASDSRRALAFFGGEIAERRSTPGSSIDWESPPPGRPLFQRAAGLDLAAYDRLRVLITELRRLAPLDPTLQIELSPRISLDQAGLLRLLSRI